MHILFISDNFPPEVNAPAGRVYEHSKAWVGEGHQVTVITGVPNFPDGKIHAGYQNKWYQEKTWDGIRVVRVKTYIAPNKGVFKRGLDYLSFTITAVFASFFQKKPDVVVGTSPQFLAAVAAWIIAVIKKKPFIMEVRDIWPESIIAVGAMKRGFCIRFMEKIEVFLYRRASKIIVVTNSFKKDLEDKGVNSDKIEVIRNGVDLGLFKPTAGSVDLLSQYKLQDKFVVGYLGTFGMAHALRSVLDAAESLKETGGICFLFAGGGAEKENLLAYAKKRNLDNVIFIPFQPKEKMPQVWSLCDVALIHLKNKPLFKKVIPSKMFEAMAMGLPIILAAPEGEAAEILSKAKCGLRVESENKEALVKAVMALYSNPKARKSYGDNGQKAAFFYERKKEAAKMSRVLQTVSTMHVAKKR